MHYYKQSDALEVNVLNFVYRAYYYLTNCSPHGHRPVYAAQTIWEAATVLEVQGPPFASGAGL